MFDQRTKKGKNMQFFTLLFGILLGILLGFLFAYYLENKKLGGGF